MGRQLPFILSAAAFAVAAILAHYASESWRVQLLGAALWVGTAAYVRVQRRRYGPSDWIVAPVLGAAISLWQMLEAWAKAGMEWQELAMCSLGAALYGGWLLFDRRAEWELLSTSLHPIQAGSGRLGIDRLVICLHSGCVWVRARCAYTAEQPQLWDHLDPEEKRADLNALHEALCERLALSALSPRASERVVIRFLGPDGGTLGISDSHLPRAYISGFTNIRDFAVLEGEPRFTHAISGAPLPPDEPEL